MDKNTSQQNINNIAEKTNGDYFAQSPGTSRFYMDVIQIATQYGYHAEVSSGFTAALDILDDDRRRICAVSKNEGIVSESYTELPNNSTFDEMMNEIRNTLEHFDYQEHEGDFSHAHVKQPSLITYFEQVAKLIRDAGFTARLDDETDEILEIRNKYSHHVAKVDGYSGSILYNGLMPDNLKDIVHDLRLTIPFENDPEREAQRLAVLQKQQKTLKLITKDNINIDGELLVEDDYVNALISAWLVVDGRFGTETYGTDDYINIYANYFPDTEKLEVGYTLIKSDGTNGDFKVVEMADSENVAILAKMKEAGLDEVLAEMNESQDSNITMQ